MQITPTDRGSVIAGIGISSLAWMSLFKLDYLAKITFTSRWISKDRLFGWINRNKSVSLLTTEVINVGVHGISKPESVLFALGSTIVNVIFIFVVIPIKMMTKKAVSL
jgi:hypothetical protein